MAFIDKVASGIPGPLPHGAEYAIEAIDVQVGQAGYVLAHLSFMMSEEKENIDLLQATVAAALALLGQLGPSIDILEEFVRNHMNTIYGKTKEAA